MHNYVSLYKKMCQNWPKLFRQFFSALENLGGTSAKEGSGRESRAESPRAIIKGGEGGLQREAFWATKLAIFFA